ncbi:MAG TPA: glycerol-3-phosphate dehydrogenase [Stellaceae bacterium]|nr:glycerol-3-phosphate dehydrogenase [Stellaceae bacterium]
MTKPALAQSATMLCCRAMRTSDIFDLLIIGGGINGVGIARDAAGRGLKVLLCDKGDLAGATSSASSKMIHGGLRYLEHGAFRLVRESLAEREVLLRIAPHLVRPMRFVLPHGPGLRPRWMLRAGLFLYDRLGGARSLPASAAIDLTDSLLGAPLRDELTSGFVYSDCVVDDARLTIANARDAARHGAEILTRAELVAARRDSDFWRATLRGADGGEREAAARTLVNVAGPWVSEVLRRAELKSRARLRLDKGSHIVVPQLYAHNHAYLLQNDDRRVVFAIPYERDYTLIGTTEVAAVVPPADAPSDGEVAYLCRAVGRWFKHAPEPGDVVWRYSGLRPLYDDGSKSASATSRDYVFELDDEGAPALSVFGGKLTTYRRLAEAALLRLAPYLSDMGPPWTHQAPLPDDDARVGAAADNEFAPGLGRAEVDFLMREEWAQTADDILWRRTKLGLVATPHQRAALEAYLASRMAEAAAPATRTTDR